MYLNLLEYYLEPKKSCIDFISKFFTSESLWGQEVVTSRPHNRPPQGHSLSSPGWQPAITTVPDWIWRETGLCLSSVPVLQGCGLGSTGVFTALRSDGLWRTNLGYWLRQRHRGNGQGPDRPDGHSRAYGKCVLHLRTSYLMEEDEDPNIGVGVCPADVLVGGQTTHTVEGVQDFTYLGSQISSTVGSSTEQQRRIGTSSTMHRHHRIWG